MAKKWFFNRYEKKYLKGSSLVFAYSDNDFSGGLSYQILQRDIYYTELLKSHMYLTKWRGIIKEVHKWFFFWLLISVGIIGTILTINIVNNILSVDDKYYILEAMPILITALVSLISTIIAIPLTIAKFLFNVKEDDNITTLINHTQDHDSSGLEFFKDKLNNYTSSGQENVTSDNQWCMLVYKDSIKIKTREIKNHH